jgi:hypothetical protein
MRAKSERLAPPQVARREGAKIAQGEARLGGRNPGSATSEIQPSRRAGAKLRHLLQSNPFVLLQACDDVEEIRGGWIAFGSEDFSS